MNQKSVLPGIEGTEFQLIFSQGNFIQPLVVGKDIEILGSVTSQGEGYIYSIRAISKIAIDFLTNLTTPCDFKIQDNS